MFETHNDRPGFVYPEINIVDYTAAAISIQAKPGDEVALPYLTFITEDNVAHCFQLADSDACLSIFGGILGIYLPEESIESVLRMINTLIRIAASSGIKSVADSVVDKETTKSFDKAFEDLVQNLELDSE